MHAKPILPEAYYSKIAKQFSETFPDEHLKHEDLDDSISGLTWTNYVNSLDPDHSYFLQSDIDKFKADSTQLDDFLKKGNLDFAYQLFEIYKEKVRNRYEYIEKLLEKGFDLTINESYRPKRDTAPFPENMEAMDELWRKKIKNEYVRRVVAKDMKKDEDEKKKEVKEESPENEEIPEVDSDEDVNPLNKLLDPNEFILKRYKNMMTVIEDTDAEWVLQRYLSSFAQAYDPHSSYMSPSSLVNFDIEMKLSLEGIGALLQPEDGSAMVVKVIPGGPASCDTRDIRLKPGDKIIGVGQGDEPPVDVLHWPLDKIVKLIRGPKSTKVVLIVIPASDPTGSTTKTVDLIRDEVKLEDQAARLTTMDAAGIDGVSRKMAIITLPAFYANMYSPYQGDPEFKSSAYDVRELLIKARGEDVEGVLLDLRNNGGGSLLEAIRMTGLFIKYGPVVQVKEKFRRVLDDDDPNIVYAGPLVIMVNRLSASASEILTSALQDYGRAVIVGDTKTHGKGTVQSVLNLDRDKKFGAVKITSAGYYRIRGDSTQLKGVTPDIIIPSPFDREEWGEEHLENALQLEPINPANFEQFEYLEPIVATLKENSRERTSTDIQFTTYTQLLGRIDEMYKIEDMPLDLESRKKTAQSEKELYEIQEKLVSSLEETTNKNYKADLVLTEGLSILADLVTMEQKEEKPKQAPAPPQAEKTYLQMFTEWLRSL